MAETISIANLPVGTPSSDDILVFVDRADGVTKRADTSTLPTGGGDALTANPLSQFAATTSLQLKNTISDETGSGSLVFATSPTLVTPVLGVATATTINGATITSGTLNGAVTGTNTGDETTGRINTLYGTTNAITVGSVEVGHATDTTLSRVSAGVIAVEGVTVPTISSTSTITNKRNTRRVVVTTQAAAPAINTDNGDIFQITGLAQAITSFTTNLTGTPVAGDMMIIQITDNGTARALTFGASFAATTVALPTTTVISTMLRIGFQRNNANTVWDCIAVA